MRQLGTIHTYWALASEPTPFPWYLALEKGLEIQSYTLFEITSDERKRQHAIDFIFQSLASGKLKPKIDRITVKAWREYWPSHVPMPHPSPRNNIWLRKNPWFEQDVIPSIQERVRTLIADT